MIPLKPHYVPKTFSMFLDKNSFQSGSLLSSEPHFFPIFYTVQLTGFDPLPRLT